ncbi:MAG: zinc ribbon domain-containing protein [Bacillota bacterium]
MPLYDFKCNSCEKKFEKLVPINERENVKCPECGCKAEQLFTFTGGIFTDKCLIGNKGQKGTGGFS